MSEEVIELSIEETNKLRADLGLPPLRLSKEQQEEHGVRETKSYSTGEEVLELSIDETNDLRAKLGLKPLRTGTPKEVHKPAENDREAKEAAERIEQSKLKRDVQKGIAEKFGSSTLADEAEKSALSWAERMRQQKITDSATKKDVKQSRQKQSTSEAYDAADLEGIKVAHDMTELEAGATTVLTLADAPLLQTRADTSKKVIGLHEGDVALENVNLAENSKQQHGLRKKRLLELGMGRAGGYAGFDDEEFEELGGTLGPARRERGNLFLDGLEDYGNSSSKPRCFRLSSQTSKEDTTMTDFDKVQRGKAISLVPAKSDVAASDYMTIEEEEAERVQRKKKKDEKFKKKKKKKEKKRRKTQIGSDEDNDDEMQGTIPSAIPSLLQQLEESAVEGTSGLRKRRRTESGDESGNEAVVTKSDGSSVEKRKKYDEIMAKGNDRTRLAFEQKLKPEVVERSVLDEEPDDSFLSAALAQARRLNRLREMSNGQSKGASAVADAIKSSQRIDEPDGTQSSGITFAIDDTREFTRAMRARAQQKEREMQKARESSVSLGNVVVQKQDDEPLHMEEIPKEPTAETSKAEEEMDIEELAKEVKSDDLLPAGLEGGTASAAGVGRGLANFVSMLKTTGEISGRHAGTEELRGRAKDERNYENYAPMDLSKVVKIGKNATDKDKELAKREVKLEYRDKYGRLLTEKEAFRDLCYQFHGHGASKKKEEKRLRQIAREQAEARLASRQVAAARDGSTAGTLGALKATQKATGKAFIVHKT